MDDSYRYIALYRTNILLHSIEPIDLPHVSVKTVSGPRKYWSMERHNRTATPNGNAVLMKSKLIELQSFDRCIKIVSVVLNNPNIFQEKIKGYDIIDETVAVMSIFHGTNIFDYEIYRGPLSSFDGESSFILETMISQAPKLVRLASPEIWDLLRRLPTILDVETRRRFQLMSKQITRALQSESYEERFLAFFFVLEIHPMRNTSNVTPITKMVERITGYPFKECEEKLPIKAIRRIRADIVHDGGMKFQQGIHGELFVKLEVLALAAIRDLIGASRPNDLLVYLNSHRT